MSKSEERRKASLQAVNKEKPNKPAWTENQQKETGAKDNEQRAEEKEKNAEKPVKIKLRTAYRDQGNAGDVIETDSEKAEQLVKLKRAEYVEE